LKIHKVHKYTKTIKIGQIIKQYLLSDLKPKVD